MTALQNRFIGTAGDDVTVASSGGSSGDAFTGVTATGGTLKYAADGGSVAEFLGSTASGGLYCNWTVPATDTVRVSIYLKLTAYPTNGSETSLLFFGSGSTRQFNVLLTDTGALRFRNNANTSTTMTPVIPLNQLVRVDCNFTRDAAAGVAKIALFTDPTSTGSPAGTIELTGQNTGSAQITNVRFGLKASTATVAGGMRVKNVRYDDSAAQAYMGPLPASPPTVNVSAADGRVIDVRGAAVTGAAAYVITQTDGPTFAPVQLGASVWRVERSTAADRVYDVTVTDTVGVSTQSVTVPKAAASSAGGVREKIRKNGAWV